MRPLDLLLLALGQLPSQLPLVPLGNAPLLPHNLTACVIRASTRPLGPGLCQSFHAFNISACLDGSSGATDAASELPLSADCLNRSACVPLYGVSACIGPRGFNLSLAQFNYSVCTQLLESLRLDLVNGTGCDVLPHNDTLGLDDNSTSSNGEAALRLRRADASPPSGAPARAVARRLCPSETANAVASSAHPLHAPLAPAQTRPSKSSRCRASTRVRASSTRPGSADWISST